MVKYLLKRLMYIVVVFFVVSIIMFIIFRSIPVDPVTTMMEGTRDTLSPEQYKRMYDQAYKKLGLDKPYPIQYLKWIGNVISGDFGYSTWHRQSVSTLIKAPLINTSLLNVLNLIIVFFITIILGVSSAVKRGSIYDSTVQVITVIGYSLPNFLIAILFILLFAVKLKWVPISGMATPDFQGTTWGFVKDRMHHMALPLAAMVFTSLGNLTRQIRTAMIEALSMDCIRTARSKGLSEKIVIFSHAFRNALIPIITVMAVWFVNIFGGSVMFERIFSWNGMGSMMIDALHNYDYAVAMAISMFYMVLALVGNLITDIVYGFVDPRVRIDE